MFAFGLLISLLSNVRANTTAIFGMSAFPLFLLIGGAIDMQSIESQKYEIQALADNTALAVVQQMAIISDDPETIEAAAKSFVELTHKTYNLDVEADANIEDRTLTINLTAAPRTYFGGPLADMKDISVSATAKLSGEMGNICLIGLAGRTKRTLRMNEEARLTARGCAIYSNSNHPQSVFISDRAEINADHIFTAGGARGGSSRGLGDVITDSPPIGDPLEGRKWPVKKGRCDYGNTIVRKRTVLKPGRYCDGIVVDGGEAILEPGEYFLQKIGLEVKNGGRLEGENVGLFFSGKWSKIRFHKESHISLTAPKTGPLAGILFASNRINGTLSSRSKGKELIKGHFIRSNDARRLVGTIYLPDDKLIIDGEEVVADQSEYTVIVARAFELSNGPNLVLRTDYHLSDIPVPEGVGPINDIEVRLIN